MVDYSRKDVILIKDLGIIDGRRMLHKALKTVKYEPTVEFCGKTECFSLVDIEQIKDIIEEMEV